MQTDKKGESKLIQESYDDLTNEIHDNDEVKAVSCYYFGDTEDPIKASIKKLDLIARKIKIEPGMRILDIGCGYGSLLKYIAENYKDVKCTGVNISAEQVRIARINCAGFPIDIKLCDFMEVQGKFDRIVCVEMMFHLGKGNIQKLLRKVDECLEEDGLFFAHTVQRTDPWMPAINSWMTRHLYKGHYIPLMEDFLRWTRSYFTLEDVQSLGIHMSKTMEDWVKNWERIRDQDQDKSEKKIQKYRGIIHSFRLCQGVFRTRQVDLLHYVFTKKENRKFYFGER